MTPGELLTNGPDLLLNTGRRTLIVEDHGDRPTQVGSHYHFHETNEARTLTVRPHEACG